MSSSKKMMSNVYNPTILLDVVWVILHISSLVLFSEILFPLAAFSSGHLFSENLFAPWQLSAPGTFSRILSSTFVGTIFSDVVLPSIGHLFFFYSSLTLLSIRNCLIFFWPSTCILNFVYGDGRARKPKKKYSKSENHLSFN